MGEVRQVLNIRLASGRDEDKITKLIAQFRVELKQLKGIRSSINLELAKEEFYEYLEAGFPIFVAENNCDELLGYLVCKVDDDVVWVESLFVSYDERRNGIATKLYNEAEKLSLELGGDTLYNWIHPNNDKMIGFLAKSGYNVLNLIEIRKPWKNEKTTEKICVGNNEFQY